MWSKMQKLLLPRKTTFCVFNFTLQVNTMHGMAVEPKMEQNDNKGEKTLCAPNIYHFSA